MHALRRDAGRDRRADLLTWRCQYLTWAGVAPALAVVAADLRSDLHPLLELLERGCPPALGARLLAPCDDDEEVWGI